MKNHDSHNIQLDTDPKKKSLRVVKAAGGWGIRMYNLFHWLVVSIF